VYYGPVNNGRRVMQLLSWPGLPASGPILHYPLPHPGLHNPLYRLSRRGTGSIKRTASSYKRGF